MEYLNEALKRTTIQALREYFLYGVDNEKYTAKSYDVRIKKTLEEWHNVVKEYDQGGEVYKLCDAFSKVLTEREHIYMEIGIQAGFQLAKEIERSGEDDQICEICKEMYSSLFHDIASVIGELKTAQRRLEDIYTCI